MKTYRAMILSGSGLLLHKDYDVRARNFMEAYRKVKRYLKRLGFRSYVAALGEKRVMPC